MSHTRTLLNVSYDSETEDSPLHNHEIDVQALGQLLQGLGGMVTSANRVLNDDQEISVRVKAGFREGSFGIPIEVVQLATSVDVLKAIGLSASVGAFTLGGALQAIRQIGNRKIDTIESTDDGNVIHVDQDMIECNDRVRELVTNKPFRTAVNKAFGDPANAMALSRVKISTQDDDGNDIHLELGAEVVRSLVTTEEIYSKQVETEVYEAPIRFLSAYAKKPGGWNIDLFGTQRVAEVLDEAFLSRLNSPYGSISFGRSYRATIQETRTSRRGGRAKREFAIVRVVDEQ